MADLMRCIFAARRVEVVVKKEEKGLPEGVLLAVWRVGRGSCRGFCWCWVGWKA